jgi:hypothetical protein
MRVVADPSKNPDVLAFNKTKEAIVSAIKRLNLEGLEERVYNQINERGDKTNIEYPCVVCFTENLVPKILPGDSVLNQYELPIGIAVLDDPGSKVHDNEVLYLTWIKRIVDLLHQERIEGLSEVTTRVEAGSMMNKRLPQFQGVKTSITVWCEIWDDRS